MVDSAIYYNTALNYFILKNDHENTQFRNRINTDSTNLFSPGEANYTLTHTYTEYALKTVLLQKENYDWITLTLLSSFILITISKAIFQRKFNLILKAIYNTRNFNALTKEINIFNEFQSLLLFVAYALNFSLLIYFLFRALTHKSLAGANLYDYLVIVFMFLAFNLVKGFVIRLTGVIFKTSGQSLEYLTTNTMFNLVAGIFLLPALIFIFYTGSLELLFISLILIVLFYMFRLYKDFFIGISVIKFSKVYLFIYLCILEILPVMLLIKLFLIN